MAVLGFNFTASRKENEQPANLLTLYLLTFTEKERGRFAGYKWFNSCSLTIVFQISSQSPHVSTKRKTATNLKYCNSLEFCRPVTILAPRASNDYNGSALHIQYVATQMDAGQQDQSHTLLQSINDLKRVLYQLIV